MNTEEKTKLSVVVPVYNSSGTLKELFNAISESVSVTKYELEVIFVDDHGNTASWDELVQIQEKNPQTVKIIRLSKNFGQNSSTLCGIDNATGDTVVTIDDDMEFHPKDIGKLLRAAEEKNADVVYGILNKAPQRSIRAVGRRVLFFVLNKVENGNTIGSSFRLMRRNIVEKIIHHNQDHLFINQIISWYTSDIEYVTVEYEQRMDSKSGYSLAKLLSIGFKLIFYYTSFPLKLIIYFSFSIAIVSFLFGCYYFIQKVTIGTQLGYSSLIVSIFMATSVIMLGLGVLAVFVNRIYNSRIKKPNYSIKKMK